jgi:outer membrane protein assembly factor BamB
MTATRHMSFSTLLSLLCTTAMLSACSESTLNPFGNPNKKNIEGERITIISAQPSLEVNSTLEHATVALPEAQKVATWEQEGGNSAHNLSNIALPIDALTSKSSDAGAGHAWLGTLIAAPVTNATHIFSMDGKATVTAAPLENVSGVQWKKMVGKEPEAPLNGGGLALDDTMLFATTADGTVSALKTSDGEALWTTKLDMPIRSAPLVTPTALIVMTTGSKIYALDKATGQTIWDHRGIQETASLMGTVTPAYANGVLVAVYPSGEVYGLQAETGKPLWSDALLLPERTSALGTFSGVGGMPVIVDDVAYSVSSNGLMIASQLSNGLRMWELPLSSSNTPWVAGDYIYTLSTEGKLLAIYRFDGRIKWMVDVPNYQHDKGHPMHIKGPFMVNGKLLLIREDGLWQQFSPETGTLSSEQDITSGATSNPAFSSAGIFVANHNANLYSIK